jgi:hypothetical protein
VHAQQSERRIALAAPTRPDALGAESERDLRSCGTTCEGRITRHATHTPRNRQAFRQEPSWRLCGVAPVRTCVRPECAETSHGAQANAFPPIRDGLEVTLPGRFSGVPPFGQAHGPSRIGIRRGCGQNVSTASDCGGMPAPGRHMIETRERGRIRGAVDTRGCDVARRCARAGPGLVDHLRRPGQAVRRLARRR